MQHLISTPAEWHDSPGIPEKPVVHSEKMFETSALVCGKCTSGPVSQAQCGSLLSNS